MTETSPVSFQSATDSPLEARVSTVGKVHPHLEAKIIDTAGRVVPRGVMGELCTRGYSVMHGYWGDEAATRGVIDPAGWMHSGDLAIIDDEGYATITGRLKDVIIRGGENIYPREIEEYLMEMDVVKDVQIFGIADPKFGEIPCAWIIPHQGQSLRPEEVRAWCKGRFAHYKIPQHVEIVEAFPLTVTGKVQKFVMREHMEQRLRGGGPD
jgi:fatty-acyl-CoA synthase